MSHVKVTLRNDTLKFDHINRNSTCLPINKEQYVQLLPHRSFDADTIIKYTQCRYK